MPVPRRSQTMKCLPFIKLGVNKYSFSCFPFGSRLIIKVFNINCSEDAATFPVHVVEEGYKGYRAHKLTRQIPEMFLQISFGREFIERFDRESAVPDPS
jgi:hypothetical protein